MGRIRTKDIKNVSHDIYEVHKEKITHDFEKNKQFLEEIKLFENKKKRNRVAGYLVRIARQHTKSH